MEVAGVNKITLYENKGISYTFPNFENIDEVSAVINSGTIDNIDFCSDINFSREVAVGQNYKQLKKDALEFFIQDFTKENEAKIKRLQQSYCGFIAMITFESGATLILQTPFFFNATKKDFNKNSVVVSANYRVQSDFVDFTLVDGIAPPVQQLFSSNIDFESNIIPDSISSNNASLSGGGMHTAFESVKVIGYETAFNWNSDFTVIFKGIELFSSGITLFAVRAIEGATGFGIDSDGKLFLNIAGTNYNIAQSSLINVLSIITLTRSGNVYTLYLDGVAKITQTNTSALTFNGTPYTQPTNSWYRHFESAFLGDALSSTEVLALNGYDKIKDTVTTYRANAYNYYLSTEGSGKNSYDVLAGKKMENENGTDFSWGVNSDKQSFNFERGFDIYTDGVNLYRVQLDLDGNSLGLNLSADGLTFVATVTQNGNNFLDCETLITQPEAAELISADINGVYFLNGAAKELSFAEVKGGILNNSYIKAITETTYSIEGLQLYAQE